jgi:hypothetical protein
MMKRKRCLWGVLILAWLGGGSLPLGAQAAPDLTLGTGDVTIEAGVDGYHLFIRQKPGAASVLLSEAFELSDHKLATYAFRPVGPNPVNDKEQRLLDGKPLNQPFLVSSTPVDHPPLGKAFPIVIPHTVEYGYSTYPNSRYGKIDVQKALSSPNVPFWFSIRVFEKPFADYTGTYKDNAFDLKSFVIQVYHPTPDRYETGLVEGFSRLGDAFKASSIDDALNQIRKILDRPAGSLDLVLCIDTTKSMGEAIGALQSRLADVLREGVKNDKSFRIGLVYYRDYMEEYLTKAMPFTSDVDQVQKDLDQAVADGGGDIPEAVVEGLWAGLTNFNWLAETRVIILLGDAPQHPTPRGEVTEAGMKQAAQDKKVDVHLIMLPQTAF